ncbi:MAG: hypothetical protein JWP52_3615 [Rhizobacter sp.]|nr:hypothetical protein [Rhizobacter sp.]
MTAREPTQTAERGDAAGESTLKLYIDSTSLPLVHQMADFVACADKPEVVKLITWLRLPLSEKQLAGSNALYVQQMAAISPAFVAGVCDLVRRNRFRRVEIHSNQFHSWRGVAPLLRALVPLLPDIRDVVRLHLYDDGSIGLLHREDLKAHADPGRLIDDAAQDLRVHVFDGKPLRWGVPQSYAWHHLFETRYHLLRRDVLLRDASGRALYDYLEPLTSDLRFDGMPHLTDAQQQRYLRLFGLNAEVAESLNTAPGRTSMLFTGTGVWDKKDNRVLCDSVLKAIEQLRANGCIPPDWRLFYKGHPVSADHDARLMQALGDDVTALPSHVPLEVLMMAGLLPTRLAGVMSSSHLTLPSERIAYLLCRSSATQSAPEAALVRLMLDAGIVSPERMLPLMD